MDQLLQKRGYPYIFSIPEHCFVAKQLNKTLFCRDTSKYGIFCQKLLKYALRAEKMAASALRADSTLSPTLYSMSYIHTYIHIYHTYLESYDTWL